METKCKQCGATVVRRGSRPGVFCSRKCKGEFQQTQKPVSKEWLVEQYVTNGLSTYAIGKIVKRNPKQVWQWLKGYGIQTRERTWSIEPDHSNRPYQTRAWLWTEYHVKGRSAAEIATQFAIDHRTVLHFLHLHDIRRRTMRETRLIKKWGATGEANPMFGKRGADNPNWKGGCTPERQAFYASPEWKSVARKVKKRDKKTCQRCWCADKPMEIHHIVGFACKELRCEATNLILLCESCHDFVHSKENTAREFIADADDQGG